MAGHACEYVVLQECGVSCAQGLETLVRLNGKSKEDLSEREQSSLAEYPLSLRILAQTSGTSPPGRSTPVSSSHCVSQHKSYCQFLVCTLCGAHYQRLSIHDLRHLPAGSRAVFEIYKRINSGGETLNDQQARKAAFW